MKSPQINDIVIIGGGIGGLTMALALHQRGIPCRVFEAASEFRPLGVGINMMPHAIRVLSALGLEEELNRFGVEAKEFAYFNRHGQKIFTEPCGRFAGYEYPHFSIHRGDLHKVLYDAVVARMGAGAVSLGHRCAGVAQDADGVTVRFEDAPEQRGGIALAYDGFHSAIRHQFYPDEGPPQFGGINMWRGVTRRKPFLTGASVTRVGTVQVGKMVIYAIRQFDDGTQLINWNTEQPRDDHKLNDWATPGRIEDFIEPFAGWNFDWLDIPQLIADAEFILEYPMVDRDPVSRWVFDRVALMGDAAHPMYPRGGNGGAQAVLDAECLARLLTEQADPAAALQAYEAERLEVVNRIVLTNRDQPPDYIIETVESLTGGAPFERIEDVINPAELAAISDRYKDIARYSKEAARGG
ncbi:MAG: 2-polyprenyl-6-methoxyphenol hydroxylase-like FAD-dependent oxidoreductase [Paracoccaceae bacterium]|jgi:2-polyprenyl-6-methoxyphenol hydroxylase-like FAD-dependent oxidoreductase